MLRTPPITITNISNFFLHPMDLLLLLQKTLVGLFSAATAAILISKLRGKRLNLPPGPFTLPSSEAGSKSATT
ncbi:UNVERIFIED_CONTAM: Trans-cinnamate 4-monooxygenase [Sesamum latifolium]|uniref:Trans-cinnamate 4-monooxygenase n=1 Tax=Sesamum latifolium TaxID=2727402 RepID=A0AAW2Y3M8_9LAMI